MSTNCYKPLNLKRGAASDGVSAYFASAGSYVAGDILKLDANGKFDHFLSYGSNNTDNGASDTPAVILDFDLTITSADLTTKYTLPAIRYTEFWLPATDNSPADGSNIAVTPTEAMVNDAMVIRRIQNDQGDTGWRGRYAAVTDLTTNAIAYCTGIDTVNKAVRLRIIDSKSRP